MVEGAGLDLRHSTRRARPRLAAKLWWRPRRRTPAKKSRCRILEALVLNRYALPESGGQRLGARLVGALRFRGRRCEMMVGTRQAVRCRGSFHQGGLNSGTNGTRWYQKEQGWPRNDGPGICDAARCCSRHCASDRQCMERRRKPQQYTGSYQPRTPRGRHGNSRRTSHSGNQCSGTGIQFEPLRNNHGKRAR